MHKFHFIAGLPRSGSTLLSALLSQNPRFSADITSPVFAICGAIIPQMNGNIELQYFFDNNLKNRMISNVFETYYTSKSEAEIIFDTHRSWTNCLDLLYFIYPSSRIICCVRELQDIIASFEHALKNNPLNTSAAFGFKHGSSIYWRIKTLMDPDTGIIGKAYDALRGAWYGDKSNMIIALDYGALVSKPQTVLDQLYDTLEERRFEHDFNNIQFNRPGFDERLGMPGLHKVRQRVDLIDRQPVLPPDIIEKYKDLSFWKDAYQGSSKAVRLF